MLLPLVAPMADRGCSKGKTSLNQISWQLPARAATLLPFHKTTITIIQRDPCLPSTAVSHPLLLLKVTATTRRDPLLVATNSDR